MKRTILPQSDIEASTIALGTADFGLKNTEAEAHALLDHFVACGGNLIDTARIYSDWIPGEIGRSERIIGDWISQGSNREKILISTKGAHPQLASMNIPRLTRDDILSDVDKSLRALRTDSIDIYYLHRDDVHTPVSDIIDALDECVHDGKIRAIACSNWCGSRLAESIEYASSSGKHRFIANQVLWNIGSSGMNSKKDQTLVTMDAELLHKCEHTDTCVVTYSSIANGYFSKVGSAVDTEVKKAQQSPYHTDINQQILSNILKYCRTNGCSTMEVVVGYLLSRPQPIIAAVGPKNIEQLDAILLSSAGELSIDFINAVDALSGFERSR